MCTGLHLLRTRKEGGQVTLIFRQTRNPRLCESTRPGVFLFKLLSYVAAVRRTIPQPLRRRGQVRSTVCHIPARTREEHRLFHTCEDKFGMQDVTTVLSSSAAGTAWQFLGFCRSGGLQRLLHGGRVLLPEGPRRIRQPGSLRFPGRDPWLAWRR